MQKKKAELHKRLMGIGKAPAQNGSAPKVEMSRAKSAFLAEFSEDYGYSGQIDTLCALFLAFRSRHMSYDWQQCEVLISCRNLRIHHAFFVARGGGREQGIQHRYTA